MIPPVLDGCRVLELGCASAGNLLPMAFYLPDSHFLCVDISPKQIAQGREIVEALGLKNIDLQAVDLLQIDKSWGQLFQNIWPGE